MTRLLSRAALGSLCLMVVVSAANAAPVRLTAADFAVQTAGATQVVEDFEGVDVGVKTDPFTLSNGTYSGVTSIVTDAAVFCGAANRCLLNQFIATARTFSTFAPAVNFWSTDLRLNSNDDVFDITVVGGSGTLTLTRTALGTFFGVRDDLGLISVSFTNSSSEAGQSSTGNYSFDNVTTVAAQMSVPEPASLALVGLALSGLAASRRRRA